MRKTSAPKHSQAEHRTGQQFPCHRYIQVRPDFALLLRGFEPNGESFGHAFHELLQYRFQVIVFGCQTHGRMNKQAAFVLFGTAHVRYAFLKYGPDVGQRRFRLQ